MTKHKLLVYGTLKRNFYNHDLLEEMAGESEFIRNSSTRFSSYHMKENGMFPAVFLKATLGSFISGELFLISDKILQKCDQLENHPVWYQRRRTPLVEEEECWMYIMRDKYIENFPIETRKEYNTQRF